MGNILQLANFNFKVGGYSDVPSAGGCALPAFREGRQRITRKQLRPCSALPLTLGGGKGPKLILWGASRLQIWGVCGFLGF